VHVDYVDGEYIFTTGRQAGLPPVEEAVASA
jgi:hypothetical protein